MPKETGLMFKAPLVHAILEGKKTQTRRLVAMPRKRDSFVMLDHGKGFWPYQSDDGESEVCSDGCEHRYSSPFGMPGDRLYVRETWQHANFPLGPYSEGTPVFYRADYLDDPHGPDGEKSPEGKYRHWSPAIHMPKAAARIWLEVTGVRVERLQQITDADALAEGVDRTNTSIPGYARERFNQLWDSTTGRPELPENKNSKRYARAKHWLDTHPDTTGWAANPWVWVIDFKRIDKP